jgi:hypothetical protein
MVPQFATSRPIVPPYALRFGIDGANEHRREATFVSHLIVNVELSGVHSGEYGMRLTNCKVTNIASGNCKVWHEFFKPET